MHTIEAAATATAYARKLELHYKDQHRVYIEGEFAGYLDRFYPKMGGCSQW